MDIRALLLYSANPAFLRHRRRTVLYQPPDCKLKQEETNMTESLEKRVGEAINEIRPRIQADGGDIELVAIEKKTVKVRLRGACAGCPMSAMTLKQGVERLVKSKVPEIESVVAVQ
jgi:Fe-S cluster biogenesis protein NfuA